MGTSIRTTTTLKYPERGMACSAAELIGEIGPTAINAAGALEEEPREPLRENFFFRLRREP